MNKAWLLLCLMLCLLLVPLEAAARYEKNYEKIIISEDIALIKLSEKVYVHVSETEMPPWGMVSSNGVILVDKGKAFLFDTPVSNEQTKTLVEWVQKELKCEVTAFVPNHWHSDCMGGIEYLHSIGVDSYANKMTVQIAEEKGLSQPKHAFSDKLVLKLNDIYVYCYYLGGGHALDNIVVWIPSEKVLFAGCMVKDMNSKGLGNLSDADIDEWPLTIAKVIAAFPDAKFVIPGHGDFGGKELLYHTQKLFNK